jgi:hypothetical protein
MIFSSPMIKPADAGFFVLFKTWKTILYCLKYQIGYFYLNEMRYFYSDLRDACGSTFVL